MERIAKSKFPKWKKEANWEEAKIFAEIEFPGLVLIPTFAEGGREKIPNPHGEGKISVKVDGYVDVILPGGVTWEDVKGFLETKDFDSPQTQRALHLGDQVLEALSLRVDELKALLGI